MSENKTSDKEQKEFIATMAREYGPEAGEAVADFLRAHLSAREESPVTPEQFTDLLKRIAVRMGGHTIPVIHGPAWHNFMGLLSQVTPYECGIGPMPSEGNSPYVNEKKS